MFKKIKNRKGFTLIELIVVIAILAVLAAIIIPTVSSSIQRAERARDLANVRSAYAQYTIELLSSTATPPTATAPLVPGSKGACVPVTSGTAVTGFTCSFDYGDYTLVNGQIKAPVAP